jgi:aryl-alcohol dehydrogenase-like predicted oxidoreductase
MNYRKLGRTGLRVSEISPGGLFFGKLANGRDTAATLCAARDAGINLIDTAAAYSGSEKDLGRAFRKTRLRNEFIVATKWWPYDNTGKKILQDPKALRASVERSLKAMRTDRVEVFQFHSVINPGDTAAILSGPLKAETDRLKREGKIRFTGISNSGNRDKDDKRLQEAAKSGWFDTVMPEFLLFRQRPIKTLFRVCLRRKVGVITIIPLGQAAWGYGLRNRKYLADSLKALIKKDRLPNREAYRHHDVLDFLLDGKTTTIAGAALRFCLSFRAVSTVCCGTNDPEHIWENAKASDAGPYPGILLAQARRLFGSLGQLPAPSPFPSVSRHGYPFSSA